MVYICFLLNYFCAMLINELSKRTGISVHTIRFYEKSGLIQGKRDETLKTNNYYHYDDETVEKLALIKDAKSVGFSIGEIGQLIEAWFDNRFTTEQKIAILDEKLRSIDEKIEQLANMKKLIDQFKEDVIKDAC